MVRRGKGGKGRVVPFGPQVARSIDRYLRMRRSHRLAHTEALWLGDNGQTFGYHGLNVTMKRRAELAGIKGFHLHLLRHTAASRWLAAGGSEDGLMAVAGWSSREMLDRYTRATASDRAAAESRSLNLGDLGRLAPLPYSAVIACGTRDLGPCTVFDCCRTVEAHRLSDTHGATYALPNIT